MNHSPRLIGLLQAAAVVAYIACFAAVMSVLPELFPTEPQNPMLPIAGFLLAFVISALTTGSAILGYPLVLFLGGEKRRAVLIVFWTGIWLAIALLALLLTALLLR